MFKNDINLLKETCKKWKDTLTLEEKKAIKIYTDDSQDINSYLLENGDEDDRIFNFIKLIDSALLKYKLPCDLWITRVENFPINELKIRLELLKYTKMIKYPNFVSTSVKENWEKEDCNINLDKNTIQIIIKAKIEKGTNCGYLDEELSYMPEEKEILVLRNSTLFIMNLKYIEEFNRIEILGILKNDRKKEEKNG